MLRFINSNRMAAVGLAAAVVLVVVTMVGRFGGRSESSGELTQPTEATVMTAADSEQNDGPIAETGGPSPATAPDPARLTVPIDPSGSRGDRTEIGAQQSAIDFAGTVQQRLVYLTESAATELLTSWSGDSPDVSEIEADIDEVATLRSTLTSGGGDLWWSVTPIASHVEAFDIDRARVSVWVVQVVGSDVDPQLGGEAVAPTVDFNTTVVDLAWDVTAGWSIWNISSSPGPVPMMSATSTMSAPTEFMDALGDFTLTKEHS